MREAGEQLRLITSRYLLCLNIKSYRNARGERYLDALWHKDLTQHTRYLKNLTVAGPCQAGEPPPDAIAWRSPQEEVRFIDLPATDTAIQAVLRLPSTAALIWRAIGKSDVVHLGVAGWPIPYGWVAWPMALMRGKPYAIVVESAPWRLQPGLPVTWKAKIRAAISEVLSRWCVNHASLVILTQEGYRRTLLTKAPDRGHVIHASWVDEENIVSHEDAAELWRSKRLTSGVSLKLLFAGRLARSKGVTLLLDTMQILIGEEIPVELDILGQGELRAECEAACNNWGAGKVRMLGTVAYDSAFFQLLRRYHAVVVPSFSDEQPRIVYDAYSQAIPVLANDTPGLRDCVENGRSGLLAASNEPASWTDLCKWCLENPDELEKMGHRGIELARGMTHRAMHRKRWRLLLDMLGRAA